jgi:hypothetical protein
LNLGEEVRVPERVHLGLKEECESTTLNDFVNIGLRPESHDQKRRQAQTVRVIELGSKLVAGDITLRVFRPDTD